jgi:hypothetical protein
VAHVRLSNDEIRGVACFIRRVAKISVLVLVQRLWAGLVFDSLAAVRVPLSNADHLLAPIAQPLGLSTSSPEMLRRAAHSAGRSSCLKPHKAGRGADDPIESGGGDLQERRGGADVAVAEVDCGGAFVDIERQRERPFVEGVEREGLELARIVLTRFEIRRRLAHGGSTILRRRPSGDGSLGSPPQEGLRNSRTAV